MISQIAFRPYRGYSGPQNLVIMNYYSDNFSVLKSHKFHEDDLPEVWKEIGRYLAEKHKNKEEANIE